MRIPDHRRPRRPRDRRLDLFLDRRQAPRDDLQQHRIHHPGLVGEDARGHAGASSDATSRLPNRSTRAANPGCTGTVAPYSSITAGPSTTSPGTSSGRQYNAVETPTEERPNTTSRLPVAARPGERWD